MDLPLSSKIQGKTIVLKYNDKITTANIRSVPRTHPPLESYEDSSKEEPEEQDNLEEDV